MLEIGNINLSESAVEHEKHMESELALDPIEQSVDLVIGVGLDNGRIINADLAITEIAGQRLNQLLFPTPFNK